MNTKILLTKGIDGKITYTSQNLQIEISDTFYESGTESPDSNESFHYIHQILNITTKTEQKKFSFYNYNIKKGFYLDIGGYKIIPLKVKWDPYTIEIVIHKN